MIAYIIDSLFFVDTPESADCYSVLAAYADDMGIHTLSEIKANKDLAAKIECLPIFAGYKYTYDTIITKDNSELPVVFSEILVNECDAVSLSQYPDLEIRRISRVNNSILDGLKAFLADVYTKAAGTDLLCNYTDPAFQLCPVTKTDAIYLKQANADTDSFIIIGQRIDDKVKTISDIWESKNLKSTLAASGITVMSHISGRSEAFSVLPAVSKNDVIAHASMFHFICNNDRNAKEIQDSYSYFDTCNIIDAEKLDMVEMLSAFVNVKLNTATSDEDGIKKCNSCFADKIIIATESDGQQYIAGLIHNGRSITIKDIVHLKSAYTLLHNLLAENGKFACAIFGANVDKPTCRILYRPSPDTLSKIAAGDLVVIDVATLPADNMRADFINAYKEVSTEGIHTVNLLELEAANSCLPENQSTSSSATEVLKALCNSFDDTLDTVEQFTLCDSIEESVGYNSDSTAYRAASAALHNVNRTCVQNTCVATFNRQLPSFTDLLMIFDEDYQNVIKSKQNTTDAHTNVFDNNEVTSTDSSSFDDEDIGLQELMEYADSIENEESDDNIDLDDTDELLDQSMSYTDLDYLHIDLDYMRLDASTEIRDGACGLGPYFDSKYYREIFASFGPSVIASPECIEGNNANNKLAIQSNEVLLYAGLYSLVLEGICYENSIYTLADLKTALGKGTHSTIVDSFLKLLTKDVVALNWRHTGTIKATLSHMTDKRDIEFYKSSAERVSSETFLCLGWYNVVMDNGKQTVVFKDGSDDDCFPSIGNYITTEVINSMAWVEAFIRLSRWNTRKPRQLWIPSKKINNNTESFLNLVNFSKQDWCGTFDEAMRITFEGAPYTIDGRLSCEASKAAGLIQILTYYNEKLDSNAEIIYGVPLCTHYKDTDETRVFYIDIFTLVNSIVDNKLAVAGIMFDSTTQTFESSTVSAGDLVVDPDSYYNNDAFVVPLTSAINNSKTQPAAFEPMISIHLTKLWTLSNLAQSLGSKFPNTRILDMLRLFEMATIDSNMLDRCGKVLETSPGLRENTINLLNRDYGNSMSKESLANMIVFTNLALPYIKLAQDIYSFKQEHEVNPSIADVLNMARAVDLSRSALRSSAETTTATPQTALFKGYYNKCTHFYSFALNGNIILYIGAADVVIQGKQQSSYVFWEPEDIPNLNALGCVDHSSTAEPVSFEFVTNSIILPFWSHCKIAYAGKNKTEITDAARRNALNTIKSLKQSRYISFKTGVTGTTQAVTDTFSRFVFDVWVAEIRRQKR